MLQAIESFHLILQSDRKLPYSFFQLAVYKFAVQRETPSRSLAIFSETLRNSFWFNGLLVSPAQTFLLISNIECQMMNDKGLIPVRHSDIAPLVRLASPGVALVP